jgi:serine/threonine protein phosphatase 1
MSKQWIIADIHGCAETLATLVEDKIRPEKNDSIYFLGDYIDRGADSKGVVDYILGLKAQGLHIETLMGNHEEVLLKIHAYDTETGGKAPEYDLKNRWFYHGGRATLHSFGIDNLAQLAPEYLHFFQNLRPYIVLDKHILVHAGLNFSLANPFTDYKSMRWIKNFNVDLAKTGSRKVIHGHVTHSLTEIDRQFAASNAICLDNGCVFAERSELGNLLALELNTMRLEIQENVELSVFA